MAVEKESMFGNVFVCVVEGLEWLFKKKNKTNKVDDVPFILQEIPRKKLNPSEELRNYWMTSTKRMKIKDAMTVFGFIGFILFASWIMANKDTLSPPYVTTQRGNDVITVSGNCTWIRDYYTARTAEILETNTNTLDWSNYTFEDMADIKVNFITQSTDITTTTLELKCPDCICPPPCPVEVTETTIPTFICQCEGSMDAATKKKLLNIMPGLNGNAAISAGYHMCKADVLDILKLKPLSKFNEGPAMGGYKEFYTVLTGNNKTVEDSICFKKQNGSAYGYSRYVYGFFLNTSLWNVNKSLEETTVWNMTTEVWTDYQTNSNHTYWKTYNTSTTTRNLSDNYFVWSK